MAMTITALTRYPVKGLSAEALAEVVLKPGACLPQDRRFALARAATEIDPQHATWLPKTQFFMLARNEALAQLHTRFDAATGVLSIEHGGRPVFAECITAAPGREQLETFLGDFLADADGPPRLVEAPGHTFSDARQKPNSTTYHYVSLVNLASVRALEKAAGAAIDPRRFRANVYFDGAAPWQELDWIDSDLVVGDARLRVVAPIVRCPATAVNPATAERDLDVPQLLREHFAHCHMGVYAEVVAGGRVALAAALTRALRYDGK